MSTFDEWVKAPDATVRVEDDYRKVNQFFVERRWSDGLPIVPPTAERVEEMLSYCDRPLNEPIAKMAPRYGEATPIRLAVNAVMAGCVPEYFPLVMLAVEAMCEPEFNLYAIQATTHMVAPLVIVNGPIARELGMNAGGNAFGPGNPANATIGRAVRLALINIGGALPGTGDMATAGAPSKYSFCVAENEAENPWQPLHVERGFSVDATTVTVAGTEPPHNVNDHWSISPEGILRMIAGTMCTTGNNDIYFYQDDVFPQPLVLFGPEHAKTVADGGFSKDDVKRFLFEEARVPLGAFSKEYIELRYHVMYAGASLDTRIPIFKRPEDLVVAVVGGAGKHSLVLPSFGGTRTVTRALKRRDGQLVRSIEELHQLTADAASSGTSRLQ